jgi:Na+:H+ antiporter, NhaA family
VRTGLTRLPEGISLQGLLGVGLLAGIGFTMSLFIASLAFPDAGMLAQAKMGVLCASVVAALAGLAFLYRALPRASTRGVPVSRTAM